MLKIQIPRPWPRSSHLQNLQLTQEDLQLNKATGDPGTTGRTLLASWEALSWGPRRFPGEPTEPQRKESARKHIRTCGRSRPGGLFSLSLSLALPTLWSWRALRQKVRREE